MFDIKDDVGFECVPHATPSMACHIMQYPYQITQTFIKPSQMITVVPGANLTLIIIFSEMLKFS
jgi:hypothetical protein